MKRLKGIVMIIVGAIFWGASGPMMEWLLINSEISVSFMLTIRLLLAGSFLLIMLNAKGVRIMRPLRQKVWIRQIIIFGIVGMLGVQYTFVAAIDTSNAVIATLFQFLAPVYIIIFISWTKRMWPPLAQVLGMIVTLGGLVLLLTNGNFSDFLLSKVAVFWGVAVGFAFSFYTLYPAQLMREWGVLLSVGWAMIIGGIALFITNPISIVRQLPYLGEWKITGMLLLVIIVGTLAFVMFLSSMKYITPIETSILSSFEPLTAMIVSVIWFGQALGFWQLTGSVIMLLGVTWILIAGNRASEKIIKQERGRE